MSVETDADRRAIARSAGELVEIDEISTDANGDPLYGIFTERDQPSDFEITVRRAQRLDVRVVTSDVPNVARGSQAVIAGERYMIDTPSAADGWTTCPLIRTR